MVKETELEILWRQIGRAGSVNAYVQQQMTELGYVVERRDAANMSKSELDKYKKELKQEAEQKRKLGAEAWKAYKQHHIVHVGEGIFWNDADDWDKWDIDNAEERAAENGLPPLSTPADLAEALKISVAQLRWFCYHRDAAKMIHYQRFTIPKRNGKEREIWAPTAQLKEIQHWILYNILERLLVHEAAHGFVPGRSIVTNAAVHTNSRLIVKMDLQDFFPTITFRRIKGLFRHAGYREQIATLLALLCSESPREEVILRGQKYLVALSPRCLPQGAPTSPAITNAICLRLDRRMTGLTSKLGWRYSRYADDLTFSITKAKASEFYGLKKFFHDIHFVVEAEGFVINEEKTRVMRSGGRQKVTGLIVNGTQPPRVPRVLRRRLRAVVHNLGQGKELHEGDFLQHHIGHAAMLYSTNPEEGKRYLDCLRDVAESTSA